MAVVPKLTKLCYQNIAQFAHGKENTLLCNVNETGGQGRGAFSWGMMNLDKLHPNHQGPTVQTDLHRVARLRRPKPTTLRRRLPSASGRPANLLGPTGWGSHEIRLNFCRSTNRAGPAPTPPKPRPRGGRRRMVHVTSVDEKPRAPRAAHDATRQDVGRVTGGMLLVSRGAKCHHCHWDHRAKMRTMTKMIREEKPLPLGSPRGSGMLCHSTRVRTIARRGRAPVIAGSDKRERFMAPTIFL